MAFGLRVCQQFWQKPQNRLLYFLKIGDNVQLMKKLQFSIENAGSVCECSEAYWKAKVHPFQNCELF